MSDVQRPEKLTPPNAAGKSTDRKGVHPPRPPYDVMWETLSVAELTTALKIGDECGCNPRASRKRHANEIALAMESGDWMDAIPDIVCLCTHGGVCNGRHRCIGAIEAGVPLTGWVGRNVPREVIRYADIGLKRQPGDALADRGVKQYRLALGAAVRLLALYDTQRHTHWSLWRQIRYSSPKIGDLYDAHYSGLVDVIDKGRQIESGTNCCPSAAYAFAYLLRREGDAEKLAEIAYGLAGGTPDVTDLLAKARNRLSREAKNRGKKADPNRAPYELGLLITAVMAREEKKRTFSFGDSAPMPELRFTGVSEEQAQLEVEVAV